MKTKDKQDTTHSSSEKRRSTFAILFYINRTKIRKDGMLEKTDKMTPKKRSKMTT